MPLGVLQGAGTTSEDDEGEVKRERGSGNLRHEPGGFLKHEKGRGRMKFWSSKRESSKINLSEALTVNRKWGQYEGGHR